MKYSQEQISQDSLKRISEINSSNRPNIKDINLGTTLDKTILTELGTNMNPINSQEMYFSSILGYCKNRLFLGNDVMQTVFSEYDTKN